MCGFIISSTFKSPTHSMLVPTSTTLQNSMSFKAGTQSSPIFHDKDCEKPALTDAEIKLYNTGQPSHQEQTRSTANKEKDKTAKVLNFNTPLQIDKENVDNSKTVLTNDKQIISEQHGKHEGKAILIKTTMSMETEKLNEVKENEKKYKDLRLLNNIDANTLKRAAAYDIIKKEFDNSNCRKHTEDYKVNGNNESSKDIADNVSNVFINNSNERKLNREIYYEASKCRAFVTKMMPFCHSVRDNIKNVAAKTFNSKDICAHIYGSMATSLALPESDLDIIISGLNVLDREQTIRAIQSLSKELSRLNYVISCKDIITARVPLIKLVINLRKLNKQRVFRQLHVDVTIVNYGDDSLPTPHPILCAKWINQLARSSPHFKPITLMLKKLVKSKSLDKPFIGDSSSYVISLMVSAFINSSEEFYSLAECFKRILEYYGEEFDSTRMMIVRGECIMLMPIEGQEGRLVVTDPFKPWVNAAHNVTRFTKLQECLRNTLKLIREGKTFKEVINSV